MSELRLYCDLLLQQVNKINDSPLAETAGDSEEVGQCLSVAGMSLDKLQDV